MATLHGKGGNVVFSGGEVTKITNWTFTSTAETAETTAMGDAWASQANGMTDFSGTCEGIAMTIVDIPADIGLEATLELEIVSGDAAEFNANAILTSITETASVDDVGRLSMSWIGDTTSITYPA